ncbi:MAG: hypothetical protein E6Q97_18280 [Desulfurellales bacterium]|nr:MAG: hypothetical protein E6Q97_18280 [Desulfurellales bacterium]
MSSYPQFYPPDAAVDGPCWCIGIGIDALTVSAGGGMVAPLYKVAPYCATDGYVFFVDSATGVGEPFETDIGGVLTEVQGTISFAGFDAEEITVRLIRTADSSIVWEGKNREHFNPAVRTPLMLTNRDTTIPDHFSPNGCLIPSYKHISDEETPVDCGCCDGSLTYCFTIKIDDIGAYPLAGDDVRDCYEAYCRAHAGTYTVCGCNGGEAAGNSFTATGCSPNSGTVPVTLYVSGTDTVTDFSVGTQFAAWTARINVGFCQWVHSGTSVTLTPNDGDFPTCDQISVTVTPLALNSDGIPVDCDGNPVDIERCPRRAPRCNGKARWRLARDCYDGSRWLYYWVKLWDTCSGRCDSGSGRCQVPIPFVLPEYLVDDVAAAAWINGDLLEAYEEPYFEADCECSTDEEYSRIDCPEPCSGTCDYTIAGYTSGCGTYGVTSGTLTIDITSDGTSGGTHIGYVYLTVASDNCTGCGCVEGTKYLTELNYWGIGGFPCSAALVGSPGGTFNCDGT